MSDLEDLITFLRSVKVSEALSPGLRQSITVETGLETALRSALMKGSDVVIAGSAGSGKTHLLTAIRTSPSDLPRLVEWLEEDEPAREPFVRMVPDATAIPERVRRKIFEEKPKNCRAIAVAINEGPLLRLAREVPNSAFSRTVQLLHDAQRGVIGTRDPSAPVVIDVGGYDPVEDGVVSKILSLPILAELAGDLRCKCETTSVCPRKIAWDQLRSKDIRDRVNNLLRLTDVEGQGILFRDLWDWVADIALGGECGTDPPTSAWFWRVFFGSSAVSARLRAVVDPSIAVFPRTEVHAWYGDWNAVQQDSVEGVELLPPRERPPLREDVYRWIKSQLFFLIRSGSLAAIIREEVDTSLLAAIREGSVQELVGAINAYMTYGVLSSRRADLGLWTDLRVERRDERVPGQVSLGEVPATDLAIRRAACVANHPIDSTDIPGARSFLVSKSGKASLPLSAGALRLLRGGRSYRTSDRPHTDMEWHLSRFFTAIAVGSSKPDKLDVLTLDFRGMTGRVRSYRLDPRLRQVEMLGGG